MSGSIRISAKHGVNPTIFVCEWCGRDTNTLGLVGSCSKLKCRNCGTIIFGSSAEPCPKCGKGGRQLGDRYGGGGMYHGDFEVLERDTEVPMHIAQGLCDECDAKRKAADDEVAKGGVYWKCSKCGSKGAVKAGTKLAIAVREKMKIAAPNKYGVEFHECSVCKGKER